MNRTIRLVNWTVDPSDSTIRWSKGATVYGTITRPRPGLVSVVTERGDQYTFNEQDIEFISP